MHLKRRIFTIILLLVFCVGIVYASTLEMKQQDTEATKLGFFDRKDTIYFWYDDDTMTNYIANAAVAFGERENVHVFPVLTSESEYLEAINRASLQEEHYPDAYLISHDSLEKAYLAGLAVEIKDVEKICNEDHFPKAALTAVTYKDKLVAYPLSFDTSALVYNETYLMEWAEQSAKRILTGAAAEGDETQETEDSEVTEESTAEYGSEEDIPADVLAAKAEECYVQGIPATIDDILNIANTYDVPEGVEGVFKWDVTDIFYNYWIVGNYMNVGGENGDDKTLLSVNNEEAIQCLEKYKDMNRFFSIEADSINYDTIIEDFENGKMVFTIATTEIVAELEQARAEGRMNFDYGVAMMPDVSDELKSRSMSVTKTIAVNGYSKNQEIANKFAAYLANECTSTLYAKTGKVSANLKANTDSGMLQIFKAEYAKSIPLPKMMETGNYWLLLERLFAKIWNDEDVTALVQELDILISSQTNPTE